MDGSSETHVVTCFLRNGGEVLLLRRSTDVGSYPGRWGAVAGHAEADPAAAARKEIEEETGLGDAVTLVRAGDSFPVDDAALGTRWIVHPFLFDCARRDVRLNWETVEAEWVMPTEILRRDTVPQLWTSYERVAPTVESVAGDPEHGSAYIATRALEVLRDRAGLEYIQAESGTAVRIRETARALLAARSAMAALANRIHRVMHACKPDFRPDVIEQEAHAAIKEAVDADEATARHAAEHVAGQHVLTLSRSGTVLRALRQANPFPTIFVAESRPACEGVGVAETLAQRGCSVALCTDAAMASVLTDERVDAILVGADTIRGTGAVVNKTGTCVAALAAQHAGIPVFVAASTDKIVPDETTPLEDGAPDAVYNGPEAIRVLNPTFDVTPAELVTHWITEDGVLDRSGIRERADRHAVWREWIDTT